MDQATGKNEKVLIAMSGGVDSSVAAFLLSESGLRCEGTTMRLFRNDDIGKDSFRTCCSQSDIDDAAEVAYTLDIPYKVTDYTFDFGRYVIDKFVSVYLSGATPNPCIDCNKFMKFDKLLEHALENGFDRIATGHYARVCFDEASGRWLLKKGLDQSKDQSYVLYMLTQDQLSRLLLPVGELTKQQVREIAEQQGFCNAKKRDSQDICFVPDGDFAAFIERYTGQPCKEGELLDTQGNVIGRHSGAVRYTIGQRRGIGFSSDRPLYVVSKDIKANTVTLGEESELYSSVVYSEDVNWIISPPTEPVRVRAKTRYRQREQPATAYPDGSRVKLVFDEPQRAVTVGQALVMYDGDVVVGGGTITGAEK